MRFSDWQLNRLRDALRAYHKFGRDPVDGRHFNWKDVSEAIFLSARGRSPARAPAAVRRRRENAGRRAAAPYDAGRPAGRHRQVCDRRGLRADFGGGAARARAVVARRAAPARISQAGFRHRANPAAIDTGRHIPERAHRRGQLCCARIDVAACFGRRPDPARADRGFL